MAYTLEWVVENRVLYSRIWGEQTLDMVRQFSADLKGYLEASPTMIHLIVDMRDMESMPRSLGALQEAMQAIRHPSFGWFISVGSISAFSRYMGTMIVKMFRLRFRRAESVEAALKFLRSTDLALSTELAEQPDA